MTELADLRALNLTSRISTDALGAIGANNGKDNAQRCVSLTKWFNSRIWVMSQSEVPVATRQCPSVGSRHMKARDKALNRMAMTGHEDSSQMLSMA